MTRCYNRLQKEAYPTIKGPPTKLQPLTHSYSRVNGCFLIKKLWCQKMALIISNRDWTKKDVHASLKWLTNSWQAKSLIDPRTIQTWVSMFMRIHSIGRCLNIGRTIVCSWDRSTTSQHSPQSTLKTKSSQTCSLASSQISTQTSRSTTRKMN